MIDAIQFIPLAVCLFENELIELAEEEGDTNSDAKRIVIDYVLKVACSEEDWNPDDMSRAYRAGNADSTQPGMMTVTFRYSCDQFRIDSGRDKRRENGIRASDDLTKRQRLKLKELKQKGSFQKGIICYKRIRCYINIMRQCPFDFYFVAMVHCWSHYAN